MAMRRSVFLATQMACLLFITVSLYAGRRHLASVSVPYFAGKTEGKAGEEKPLDGHAAVAMKTSSSRPAAATTTPTAAESSPPSAAEAARPTVLSQANLTAYVDAILDPEATTLPRMHCPRADLARYGALQRSPPDPPQIEYLLALDLREVVALLPRLLGSILEALRFLGPRRCALSVVEGNSNDGTNEVLAALRPALASLGALYFLRSSDINPLVMDRVHRLAALRNLALRPLLDDDDEAHRFSAATTVLFVNDVAVCPDDLLELLHQRTLLGADMTCAMDWTNGGPDATFYDVWVARGITGDSFFHIPATGSWEDSRKLFWNDEPTRRRLEALRPFQVFSCWNGAVAFTAAPLLEGKVRFRGFNRPDECVQGEPQLFCKDLWFHGHGKIAVIPTVNLEYTDETGRKIKEAKGYTSELVAGEGEKEDGSIEWKLTPPDKVLCMETWYNQYWQPWNVTLV